MSSYDAAAQQLETEEQQQEQSYLSQEERDTVKRILKFPEEFPKELGAWVEDYMGTHGVFQKSQVQGLPLLFTQMQETLTQLETVVDQLSVIGTTYQSAFAPGGSVSISGSTYTPYDPTVNVPAGTFFCILTGEGEVSLGAGNVNMQIYNSTSGAFGNLAFWSDEAASGQRRTMISTGSTTLATAGQIRMLAAEGGNGSRLIHNASLIALRTG